MPTVPDLLQGAPAKKVAVIIPETAVHVTYESLREQVARAAAAFVAAGIRPGDRIALSLPNGLASIVCLLAASSVATAAPLNPAYREEEVRFYLQDTGARLIVTTRDAPEAVRLAAGKDVPVMLVETETSGSVRMEAAAGTAEAPSIDPEAIALILHTSGSTGRPKRVPLRHRNLAASAANIARTYNLGGEDVSMAVMPLFHVHGLVASTLATFLSHGTVVVPSRFNPLVFWRQVQDHRVSWYSAVPTIHQMLAARSGRERPAGAEQLRFIRSCSAPLSPETMQAMESAFGAPMLEAYGMTEASHQMASNPLPPAVRKAGSVGVETGVEIRILGESREHLPKGQPGEVVIRGPGVIDGYEDNPEANAASFVGGWFRTGDQGVIDGEGYLSIVGRIKEMINRGGEKISPREIDEVLMRHPEVAEAVSFGVPHRSWGEEVEAAVVLKDKAVAPGDVISFCKTHLADFKCPARIHVVDTIPRTSTGKIQRQVVAASIRGEQK